MWENAKSICQDPSVDEFIDHLEKCAESFAKKQAGHGTGNIAKFGEVGLLVRLNDKVERLINLVTNSERPENEAIDDTLRDIANYAIIWLIVRDANGRIVQSTQSPRRYEHAEFR
ncbi:hypothetical protein [Pseudothermotoga sp.]